MQEHDDSPPAAMLKLYQILHDDPDGNNKDLIVQAVDPAQAFELWGAYYFGEDWSTVRIWHRFGDKEGGAALFWRYTNKFRE